MKDFIHYSLSKENNSRFILLRNSSNKMVSQGTQLADDSPAYSTERTSIDVELMKVPLPKLEDIKSLKSNLFRIKRMRITPRKSQLIHMIEEPDLLQLNIP